MEMPSTISAYAAFFPENFYLCKLTFCGLTFETMASALQTGWLGFGAPLRLWKQLAGPYRTGKIVFQNGGWLRTGLSRFREPFRTGHNSRQEERTGAAEPAPMAGGGVEDPMAGFRSLAAHDLKSSLLLIRGFIRRLTGQEELDPERRRRYLDIIGKEGEKLSALLDDFLAPEHHGLQPEIRAVPVDRELHDLCEAHQLRAEGQGIVLALECPPQLAPLLADGKRLQRAWGNLLDNAIKFSPPGSTIRVLAQEEGCEVRISFADEGPGIEAGDLPHLFEAHYRGQGRNEIGGFGLGLATVKAVAAAHGGRVEVKNRGYKGAVFTMVLPRQGPGE